MTAPAALTTGGRLERVAEEVAGEPEPQQVRVDALEFGDHVGAERMRRQRAGRVSRVDSSFFNVLHDSADNGCLTIGYGVDIELKCLFKEFVDQNRFVR